MPKIVPKKARKNQWAAFSIAAIVFMFSLTLVWKIQYAYPDRFY